MNEITYRKIAIMLAKHLPLEDEEFKQKVDQLIAEIKKLPKQQRIALRSAYIFSQKAPKEEREDLFQDLILNLLEASPADEKLAYSIARCDWRNWWAKYPLREHYSLDSVIEDEDGEEVTLGELLVGETEFEAKVCGKLDAARIWRSLPKDIKPVIKKRLAGRALTNTERSRLNRWIKREGYQLLIA
jgi:hypothetical protein